MKIIRNKGGIVIISLCKIFRDMEEYENPRLEPDEFKATLAILFLFSTKVEIKNIIN
jgi:hypothetical protein